MFSVLVIVAAYCVFLLCYLQADIKLPGLPLAIVMQAVQQAFGL